MELKALGLSKHFTGKNAVDEVNISVFSGEIIGLLGPNGAGKTTFFYMIAGLISSDAGQVFIDNKDITTAQLMKKIPGPDFPTGGIVIGKDILKQGYNKGRGSFKIRGALTWLLQLTEKQRQQGVITASAGNHGLSVAAVLN